MASPFWSSSQAVEWESKFSNGLREDGSGGRWTTTGSMDFIYFNNISSQQRTEDKNLQCRSCLHNTFSTQQQHKSVDITCRGRDTIGQGRTWGTQRPGLAGRPLKTCAGMIKINHPFRHWE